MIPRHAPKTADRLLVMALAVATAAALTASEVLWRWDRAVYDWLLPTMTRDAEPPGPVIIAIDERSLARLGRWPWPRQVHARMLERLTRLDARAIGMDLLFAEPDPDPGADRRLAAAIAANGRVVLPVLAESERLGGPMRETLSVPDIAAAAAALGHVDLEVDADGLVRSTFLQAGLGAPRWPSFAVALARLAGGATTTASGATDPTPSPSYHWVREDPVLIPYLGPPGRFPRLSYSDVLEGRVPDSLLRGRVVLVGATATGLGDALATPVSARSLPMSGVEVLANVYRGVTDDTLIVPAGNVTAMLLAVACVLLPVTLYPYSGWRRCAVVAAAAVTAPFALSGALLGIAGVWWAPLGAVAGNALGFGLWAWRRADSTRAALAEGRRQAAATLRSIGDGVVTTDSEGRITYLNPVAEAMAGCSAASAVGKTVGEVLRLVDADSGENAIRRVAAAMRGHEPVPIDGHLDLVARDGTARGVDLTVSRVVDGAGRPFGWVLAIRDVSEARELARQVSYQASHDALTDLPNRTLLRDRLGTGIARARRGDSRLAVVFIDLDRFKSVNDSFGHDFGDQLLIAMATRLREVAREQDTVARIGGDEFVVIIDDLHDPADVTALARRLREAVARPINVDGQDLFMTASVGVSVFPRDATSVEDLLRNADAAMYRAKESGRNTVRFYSEDLNRVLRRRAGLERALRRALEDGGDGLELHFQPIVRLSDGRIAGSEALLRWNSADYGRVGPEEFVSVAEESGLIVTLGEWVLLRACRQTREWQESGLGGIRCSVNLSPRQIAHQDVPRLVRRVLDETGLDPALLEVEITESVMVHDVERNAEALRALKALGVTVAVDDFGTGYSSLSFLKRFPVDRVKIDKSFVNDLGSNRESTAIVKAVLAMAQSLSLGVVAEGLETRAQVDYVSERGCDEGQGFYLSRPGTAAEIAQRLRSGVDLRAG